MYYDKLLSDFVYDAAALSVPDSYNGRLEVLRVQNFGGLGIRIATAIRPRQGKITLN